MDITERIERLTGNTPLERKKLQELVEENFETAMIHLEQLDIVNVIPLDKKNKIRSIIRDLQKIKLDVLKELE